jgi:hypothetical protein
MSDRGVSWAPELAGGLPDSRLSGARRRATTRVIAGTSYEQVFCANCGDPGGYVTEDMRSPHIFYVCERCVACCGEPPAPRVPGT